MKTGDSCSTDEQNHFKVRMLICFRRLHAKYKYHRITGCTAFIRFLTFKYSLIRFN